MGRIGTPRTWATPWTFLSPSRPNMLEMSTHTSLMRDVLHPWVAFFTHARLILRRRGLYGPWAAESDTAERLSLSLSLRCGVKAAPHWDSGEMTMLRTVWRGRRLRRVGSVQRESPRDDGREETERRGGQSYDREVLGKCLFVRLLLLFQKFPSSIISIRREGLRLSHVLTLCDPVDWSPPGSSVHGKKYSSGQEYWSGLHSFLQGIFPTQGANPMLSHFSHVWLFAVLWTISCQAPLSMGFSR